MIIREIKERSPLLIEQLLEIWEKSVKATHLFLTDKEIENIKKYVPEAIENISNLVIMKDENKNPLAFMGIDDKKLEMLFVNVNNRGKGIGTKLIQYGMENFSINEVTVNEQNPLAIKFYENRGFTVYKRTDIDEQGNPYPLLYMKLKENGKENI